MSKEVEIEDLDVLVLSSGCAYINLRVDGKDDLVVYLDVSTGEQIVKTWKENDPEDTVRYKSVDGVELK